MTDVFDELGRYKKHNWRIFGYNTLAKRFFEYQDGLDRSVNPGTGYLLIYHRRSHKGIYLPEKDVCWIRSIDLFPSNIR